MVLSTDGNLVNSPQLLYDEDHLGEFFVFFNGPSQREYGPFDLGRDPGICIFHLQLTLTVTLISPVQHSGQTLIQLTR